MENSTKALLIVASVLIVIIIIALAVNLLNVNDDSAEAAGDLVQEKTTDASKTAVSEIGGVWYKNLIPSSTDEHGNIFNGTGYKNGYRLNSEGKETPEGNKTVSGFIKYKPGDVIYTKGSITRAYSTQIYFCVYDSNHTCLDKCQMQSIVKGFKWIEYSDGKTYGWSLNTSDVVYKDTAGNLYYMNEKLKNGTYFRFNLETGGNVTSEDQFICTINKKIE